MILDRVLVAIALAFWLLIVYYSALTLSGLVHRGSKRNIVSVDGYPSVTVLIPAYNEEKVLPATLKAMIELEYPGELTVLVLNDGSADATGEIADFFSRAFRRIKHVRVPPGVPKGKARVLNYGLSLCKSDYVAVYDADNQPQKESLRLLVEAALSTPGAAGAVGYVRTINSTKNWLTRMISLEFSVFQLLMQCGRWKLFRLGSLPGTNMILLRSILVKLNGWDNYALAEDAELTLRLTSAGWVLPIVPESVTWEQEPETFRVWFRQRLRWMRGNLYLISKSLEVPEFWKGRTALHTFQLISVYLLFVFCLLLSDLWFVLGLLRLAPVSGVSLPLLSFWCQSWVVYMAQLLSALVVDSAATPANLLVAFSMYFSYAQVWLGLVLAGVREQFRQRRSASEPVWEKSIRF